MDLRNQLEALSKNLTIEKLWGFHNFSPNPEQEAAIRHVDGPLYLTAGPGSGKTRVLLWRALNLIVFHDVDPQEIFLSTFTEKAALQLKEGLQVLLGRVTNYTGKPYDLSNMYVGTVHSLCHRILNDRRRFTVDRARNRPPSLLDELGQYFHIARRTVWEEILEAADLDPEDPFDLSLLFEDNRTSRHSRITNLIKLFNRFSEERIHPESLLKEIQKENSSLIKQYEEIGIKKEYFEMALKLYISYRETLLGGEVAKTDFALIQQEALNMLEGMQGSEEVFQHVIVDEYQDTNAIQEMIFFKLASGNKNVCVVGDDDQSLYRFRGATVENFVQFPYRIKEKLSSNVTRISLSTNYRSRKRIVDFYAEFMNETDWSRVDGKSGHYRVIDKKLTAHRSDAEISIVASEPDHPDDVVKEIASLVHNLIREKKVKDPNQIAFLFPSLKSVRVRDMREALNSEGLEVYAPRAGTFLDVPESLDIFGLLTQIFDPPQKGDFGGHDYDSFMKWIKKAKKTGRRLMKKDPYLRQFVEGKRLELKRISADNEALLKVLRRNGWEAQQIYDLEEMKRPLFDAPGLSTAAKKIMGSTYLDKLVKDKADEGQPVSINYIIRRVTSVDWSLLDLFYRFCGFDHFIKFFDLAESGNDEGPVHNLGLITEYLARFIDDQIALVTADVLQDDLFSRIFYMSYLYTLYRMGESEYEDADDPFPKGRIPFLTIHQAKGLEFPVVVLGNPRRREFAADVVERIVRPITNRDGAEPLDKVGHFDNMRLFYVANSRAKNLLVIAHYRSQGNFVSQPFRDMLDNEFKRIKDLDLSSIPEVTVEKTDLPKTYSFTADYLNYKRCARSYMVFRKYGFVPSRSETMLFGSLVHRTLEDLHHELIRRRETEVAV